VYRNATVLPPVSNLSGYSFRNRIALSYINTTKRSIIIIHSKFIVKNKVITIYIRVEIKGH